MRTDGFLCRFCVTLIQSQVGYLVHQVLKLIPTALAAIGVRLSVVIPGRVFTSRKYGFLRHSESLSARSPQSENLPQSHSVCLHQLGH